MKLSALTKKFDKEFTGKLDGETDYIRTRTWLSGQGINPNTKVESAGKGLVPYLVHVEQRVDAVYTVTIEE